MLARMVPRITLAWCATAAILIGGCTIRGGGPPLEGDVPQAPVLVSGVVLPSVAADGSVAPFEMRAREGGLLLVFFGFVNCPDICPTTLSDARRALASLGPSAERIDVAFITVDPARDTAAVLTDYLSSFFESRAHALRPSTQAELGRAQTAFRATSTITRQPDGHIDVSHTAFTYVVDASGRVLVEWPFATPAKDMAHDLRILMAAAARAGDALATQPGRSRAAATPEHSSSSDQGIEITDAWVRASPRGATMGAAYLMLQSDRSDRLVGVATDDSVAGMMEMHEIVRDGDALRMQQVESLELPPGERVALEPGGRHLMFMGLRRPLVPGMQVRLRLRFEHAGERFVTAEVR